jgi:hypothetical protein
MFEKVFIEGLEKHQYLGNVHKDVMSNKEKIK